MSSMAGISSLGSGTDYNFTSMTSQQLLQAGGSLYQQGKISSQENATLMGLACDSAPINGAQSATNSGLNSNISQNFIDVLQNQIGELKGTAGGDAGEQKSLTTDQALLQALTQYQGQSAGSSVSQDANQALLNFQA